MASTARIGQPARPGRSVACGDEDEWRAGVGGGDLRKESHPVILSDIGVTPMQSHQWQKLGALDDDAFEARAVVAKRQAVSSVEAAALLTAEH